MYEDGYGSYGGGRKNSNLILIILVVVLVILLISLVGVFAINSMNPPKGGDTAIITNGKDTPPVITVTSCPQQVTSENPSVTLEGFAVSDASACTVTINGEEVAASDMIGSQIGWSKTYTLSSGETKTFEIEVRDQNNRVASESRSVYCQPLLKQKKKQLMPIGEGVKLVKSVSDGIYIRSTPYVDRTNSNVVYYIEDYQSNVQMTCMGTYTIGRDGYKWYYVRCPNGKYGYVRSDIVRSNSYW